MPTTGPLDLTATITFSKPYKSGNFVYYIRLKNNNNNNNQSFIAQQNRCANPIPLHSEETNGEKGRVWIDPKVMQKKVHYAPEHL